MGLFPTDDPAYAATYAQESAMVDAAELIAAALEASGLSQSDLARKLGVSRSEITARLRGERNITVRKLAETLHALGARLDLSCELPKKERKDERLQRWAPSQAEHHVDRPAARVKEWSLDLAGAHR